MKKGKDGFYNKYIKRILDFTLSLTALIVLSPLLMVLTVIGSVAMKGNPFFVQERPGKDEKIFRLIKFRTMTNEKDADGKLLPDKCRLNFYGRLIRKTSLDELGSLLNILVGHMSIVGPRPLLVEYLPYYSDVERKRHTVRPGLTGWAQVNGRNSVEWSKRFALDVEYVNNISIFLDIKIIFLTIKKVITRRDVAEDTRAIEGNFAEIRKARLKI